MINERRADQGAGRPRGPALILAVAVALLGVACRQGQSGPEPTGSEPPEAAQAGETAEDECRTFGRLLGLDVLAQELDAPSQSPRDVAQAYATRAPEGLRDAAFEGCLAGVQAAVAMEQEAARIAPAAAQAAERAGCTRIRVTPDEGRTHLQEGDPPPEYRTTPAASGPHRSVTLPPETSVYHEPVDEPTAVHNLEHGYALLYYRPQDPTVGPEVVAMVEGLAREFEKVVVAPHRGLPGEAGLAMVAWRRLQRCPPPIAAADAEAVARSFVLRFAATDVAPEPLGG
ncbi:MAG: DUF3105 domain-containing protein [Actinomycetota bacterium]